MNRLWKSLSSASGSVSAVAGWSSSFSSALIACHSQSWNALAELFQTAQRRGANSADDGPQAFVECAEFIWRDNAVSGDLLQRLPVGFRQRQSGNSPVDS
jgi:hypothetical protein